MKRALPLMLPLGLMLAACVDPGGDYPALLPSDQILAEPSLSPEAADPATVETALAARASALRARAEALRGPVIEPPIRARMAQAVARHS